MSIIWTTFAFILTQVVLAEKLQAPHNTRYHQLQARELINGTYQDNGNGSYYKLLDQYDHTNFWDKWQFWDVRHSFYLPGTNYPYILMKTLE